MGYDLAIVKAWMSVDEVSKDPKYTVRLLSDEYEVDVENKRILSLACNVVAKPHISILILHYLVKQIKGLARLTGEWISFKQLEGGKGYYVTFRKRVIEPIIRKYSPNPASLFDVSKRFKAKKAQVADVSIILDVLDNVPFLITFQPADDEFGPDANVLFDKSIKEILCTEDIVVLAEFIAHNI